MSVAEFLLKFTGKSLLNLVEVLKEWNWNKDHNCSLVVSDIELIVISTIPTVETRDIPLVQIESGVVEEQT